MTPLNPKNLELCRLGVVAGSGTVTIAPFPVPNFYGAVPGGDPNACSIDDDFTGVDGDVPDAGLWVQPADSAFRIQDSQLRIRPDLWPASPAVLVGANQFTGDFDIAVDHMVETVDPGAEVKIRFVVAANAALDIGSANTMFSLIVLYTGGTNSVWNVAMYGPNGADYSWENGDFIGQNADILGKALVSLRLKRAGATMEGYVRYNGDADWTLVGSYSGPEVTDVSWFGFKPNLYVENNFGYDDFRVLEGCPGGSGGDAGGPVSGNAPLTVNFTDLSTGNPIAWKWWFGDLSENSFEQNPSHIYTEPGTYDLTLEVKNLAGELGKRMLSLPAYVTVTGSGISPDVTPEYWTPGDPLVSWVTYMEVPGWGCYCYAESVGGLLTIVPAGGWEAGFRPSSVTVKLFDYCFTFQLKDTAGKVVASCENVREDPRAIRLTCESAECWSIEMDIAWQGSDIGSALFGDGSDYANYGLLYGLDFTV